MAPGDLEYPGTPGKPDWLSLYRARDDEVMRHRPIFTGDVFEKVTVQSVGTTKVKDVIVLQHPCALRTDGITLHSRLVVAELRQHTVIPHESWISGHYALMPLPELRSSVTSNRRHQAAFFNEIYLAGAAALDLNSRIACLSPVGVNLLLQRWVHHNSRVVVPTFTYEAQTSPSYEEAELIETWCEERTAVGIGLDDAATEAMKWLREDAGNGVTHQVLLQNPQSRSAVRRQMRTALKALAKMS